MTSSSLLTQRAMVLHPAFKREQQALRSPARRLEEAVGLALAIELEIVEKHIVPISEPKPATLIGEGKITELAPLIEEQQIGLVVVDSRLSPVQQRNLEQRWKCKVIDRTALILEIFGARARTAEGKLQVELASLNYQKSRLVRSWTHLERQRGGFGFLGGPGETQIEADRRMIRDRIAKISRELETVVRTRELHRKVRRDVPYPLVALVGYTNAGKSTLFNRLTRANVTAEDKLFATLDPTIRSIKLPSGMTIMLSDTVGFVSDLPTDLIAAFRATLEEVREADLILHVRDISHPDSAAQKADVLNVLSGLLPEETLHHQLIEVRNKIDLLSEEQRLATASAHELELSAVTGEGIQRLLNHLDQHLGSLFQTTLDVLLPAEDGKSLAWLYSHGKVISQIQEEDMLRLEVRLSRENKARFEKMKQSA